MRIPVSVTSFLSVLDIGCSNPTAVVTLPLSTSPDITGFVTQVTHEEGNSPAGFISQYDVWIAFPSRTSNGGSAGVVVAKSTPVFVQSADGEPVSVTPGHISAGDTVEIWHNITVVYGSAQAPPGAPAYEATQVVISR